MNIPCRASTLAATMTLVMACNPVTENESASRLPEKVRALDGAMATEGFRQITSVLASIDGETIFEHYWHEGGPAHLNDTRSAMKSLAAMAVGAAIAKGHLPGVDARVFDRFAAERPYDNHSDLKDEITLRDLLTMTSALNCNDNDWDSPGNEEHMYPKDNWTRFVVDLPTKPGYERNDAGYGPFSYCTAGSFFLGQIIERSSGQRVDEFVAANILEPLGIERIAWDKSPDGEIQTGGGAEMTARDLLTLGELVLNQGRHDQTQILPAEWVTEMTQVHAVANDRQDYGYQWWREDFRCGEKTVSGWYMAGNGGNKVAVFQELDMVAVVTSTLYNTRGMHQQSADIINDFLLTQHPSCQS